MRATLLSLAFLFSCAAVSAAPCDPPPEAQAAAPVLDKPHLAHSPRSKWGPRPLRAADLSADRRIRWPLVLRSRRFAVEVGEIEGLWQLGNRADPADVVRLIRAADALHGKWRSSCHGYPGCCRVSGFISRLRCSCRSRLSAP